MRRRLSSRLLGVATAAERKLLVARRAHETASARRARGDLVTHSRCSDLEQRHHGVTLAAQIVEQPHSAGSAAPFGTRQTTGATPRDRCRRRGRRAAPIVISVSQRELPLTCWNQQRRPVEIVVTSSDTVVYCIQDPRRTLRR